MGRSPGGGFVVRLQDGFVGGFPKAGVITSAWGKILNNRVAELSFLLLILICESV